MKTRITTLAVATAFALASALFAQEIRQESQRSAPQAQQVPDQPEIPTRTAIALVLTCMSAVAAQEPAVFRASTDVLLVPVSVTDQNGRFVHGLTADHFEISEGGTRHAVKPFSVDRVPVSLGILLDISGSITEDPKIRADERARWADMRRALALRHTARRGRRCVLCSI